MSVIFKCKMCGGTLQADLQKKIAVCDSCGTEQTISSTDDEKKANMFDRANHLRMNNEYDKALAMYEKMLELDGDDAEIYWSMVLCKYGIEYVEDPATHKRIPTINRLQYDSVLVDSDYKMALQKANPYQKEIYEKEAQIIDDIQKGILAISKQEEPFDVFICYKETDNSGMRTRDSVLANDLYHQLSNEGFKVFYSRITLEDKLGEQYEPYIFAALNSAKVMVVLGTNKDYFNAVWVKNEWSRFLTLAKKDGHKTLIPAYKDMDPYDLPEEFSHLQAQDMAKLGFMTDLIRGIKKILELSKGGVFGGTVNMGQPQMANNNINSLLKRAQMALEAGEFARADEFCEQVLNQDAENGVAYLGKLMVDTKTHVPKELKEVANPFDNNLNYQRCIRYADKEIVNELDGYNNYIKERNAYNEAVSCMEKAETEKDYNNAATKFQELGDFENSAQFAKECLEKANELTFNQAEKLFSFARDEETFLEAAKLYEKVNDFYDVKDKIAECQQKVERIKHKEKRKLKILSIFVMIVAILIGIYNVFIKYTPMEHAKVGDLVQFGSYQGESIEWQVLDVKEGKALLLSKYGLDVKPYNDNERDTDVTWETCSLRYWLNYEFYSEVFSAEERQKIVLSKVTADKNPQYNTSPGNDTQDKIFLFSIHDVEKYLKNDVERICYVTNYVMHGKRYGDMMHPWWLRSPARCNDNDYYGRSHCTAAIVDTHGLLLDYYGKRVDYSYGVRPALWVRIE